MGFGCEDSLIWYKFWKRKHELGFVSGFIHIYSSTGPVHRPKLAEPAQPVKRRAYPLMLLTLLK